MLNDIIAFHNFCDMSFCRWYEIPTYAPTNAATDASLHTGWLTYCELDAPYSGPGVVDSGPLLDFWPSSELGRFGHTLFHEYCPTYLIYEMELPSLPVRSEDAPLSLALH